MGKENIITLKQGEYLSDALPKKELPHGLIIKEETGIGATSVELFNYTRSTILVFPNKALAATKTISTKKKFPQKKIFYDGSEFYFPGEQLPKLTDEIFKELLAGDEIFKIAMVSNTFEKRFRQFDKQIKNHENLFILFDEADMYQTESNYREVMEDCMRIFLQLPEKRRCLLTATHESYTAEEFQNLNETHIKREDAPKKPIDLYFCEKDPLATLVEVVKKHIVGNQKIVIALNGVDACHYVVKELESEIPDLKGDIGVLCSETSYHKIPGNYISTLQGGKLINRITFITTAYFSGVDILDDAHIIVCSYIEISNDYTLLSMHRIRQAFGRVRNSIHSRSFICSIYKDLPKYNPVMIPKLKNEQSILEEFCNKIFACRSSWNILPDIQRQQLWDTLINATAVPIPTNREQVNLVRNKNGTVEKRIMCIDFLNILYKSFSNLYRDIPTCKSFFIANNFVPTVVSNINEKDRNKDVWEKVRDTKNKNQIQKMIEVINNPEMSCEDRDAFELQYLIRKIRDTHNKKQFTAYCRSIKHYIESSNKANSKIHRTFTYIYIIDNYRSELEYAFHGETKLTYLRIMEITSSLQQKLKHSPFHPIYIKDFDFRQEKDITKILDGDWKGLKPDDPYYGCKGKESIRNYKYEGVKKCKSVIRDFIKFIEDRKKSK